MNIRNVFSFIAAAFLAFNVFSADKLAVAEPVGKGGVPAADIEAFWGILETSVQSDEYKLITRGALKQMLTEIGLTTSSDLVNLNSSQKAKLGQLETVKYILVSEIGKFGTRYNCTMKILDASTGEIDQARTANIRVRDMDELADKIEAAVRRMLSDDKQLRRSAILSPVIPAGSPAFLAEDFSALLESGLLKSGVKLQNLRSVAGILRKNGLDNLSELEPKMYVKAGQLLEVETLIQATITRFEVVKIRCDVVETGTQGYRYIGCFEGKVSVVSAQNGEIAASIPFADRINFRSLSRDITRDWTGDDYGKYLVRTVVTKKIIPELRGVQELKRK